MKDISPPFIPLICVVCFDITSLLSPGLFVLIAMQVLKDKVAKGEFGRKSGKGFYHWEGDKIGAPVE